MFQPPTRCTPSGSCQQGRSLPQPELQLPRLISSTVWHYCVAIHLQSQLRLHPLFLPCNLLEVLHKARSLPQAQRVLLAQSASGFSHCVVLLKQLLRNWKVETLLLQMDAAIQLPAEISSKCSHFQHPNDVILVFTMPFMVQTAMVHVPQ